MCGASDTTQLAGPDDIRLEVELLWAFHTRRLSPRVPPERLVDRVAFSQEPPWRVVRCRACGLVYRNPAERPSELRAAYTAEAAEPDVLSALHHSQRDAYRTQVRRLGRRLKRGAGLEVGSYVGAFLAAARQARWPFEGLDVNPGVNAFVRSLGFVVHDGDLESFRPDRAFDVVAIWNTFDQLPDPRAAIAAARRLLRPRGWLAIRVPNGDCYARWRTRLASRSRLVRGAMVAALAYNNLLTFPYRFGFSPTTLRRLLEDAGFEVREVVRDALVPTRDEWTKRWAGVEERVVKRLTRASGAWIELYARSVS